MDLTSMWRLWLPETIHPGLVPFFPTHGLTNAWQVLYHLAILNSSQFTFYCETRSC